MTSQIDPTVPAFGTPTTASIRNNFLIAKNEISALQSLIVPPLGNKFQSTINNLVTNNTTGAFPGSVGEGPLYVQTTRTGGFGQYGNALFVYNITAPTPAPQFDTGLTSWVTHTNLIGGQAFGGWIGANSPAKYKGETWTSGGVTGVEINFGNRWADLGLQIDVGGPQYTTGINLVPDVLPASGALNTAGVSITVGSPATFNFASHGFYANMGVVFYGTAGLSGITDATTYFVSASGLTANSFEVSATIGGSAINVSGAPTGGVVIVPSWPGSFGLVQSASIHGHQTYVQQLVRFDSIAPGGFAHLDCGGSVANGAPEAWTRLYGYWMSAGLDTVNAHFGTNIAISLGDQHEIWMNGAVLVGGGGGSVGLTTGSSGPTGTLAGNSFHSTALTWNEQAGAAAIAFYGSPPVNQRTIIGALSLVTDANAKAVLTSIISALEVSGLGLVINGTT